MGSFDLFDSSVSCQLFRRLEEMVVVRVQAWQCEQAGEEWTLRCC